MNTKKKNQKNAGPPERLKILFADDEPPLQKIFSEEFRRQGHEATICPDGETAFAALERNVYDCILVDYSMPGHNGLEVIAHAKEISPETEAIILTGHSTEEIAIQALKLGACDYLTKPCKMTDVRAILERVAEKRKLTKRCMALTRNLQRIEGQPRLLGESVLMRQVKMLIEKVAPSQAAVLVLGETGTGKELAARAIHQQSQRADRPFVAINCGGLPETLIESELFGHRRGAFTGADENRVGLFEVADGGTIFLDEIGELPLAMQSKLLRVLESGEIRRVGDNESFRVDTRLVCATNRPLREMVDAGDFREDLMFRINAFEIQLPALRERIEDIPLLAASLFGRFCPSRKECENIFSPEAMQLLQGYDWPGNVRELANAIEHATILVGSGGPILPEHLPSRLVAASTGAPASPSGSLGTMSLKELEMEAIRQSLDRHEGNKPAVAEELGISLKTLYNRLGQVGDRARAA